MKHFKALLFMAVGLILGFSSCLDNENTDGRYYDFSAYMTVPGDFAMTGRVITDNDITLYVRNTSAVAYQDGSYPERIYAYVKVLGEEFDTTNPKDRYAVQIVEGYVSPIITVNMNTRPDTLEHHSVHKIPNLWAGNGYLNIPFIMYTQNNPPLTSVNAFIDRASHDTLFVKFSNGTTGSNLVENIFSFRLLPSMIEASGVTPNDGKIIINVTSACDEDAIKGNCQYQL